MKIIISNCFLIFWTIFALWDPDPDPHHCWSLWHNIAVSNEYAKASRGTTPPRMGSFCSYLRSQRQKTTNHIICPPPLPSPPSTAQRWPCFPKEALLGNPSLYKGLKTRHCQRSESLFNQCGSAELSSKEQLWTCACQIVSVLCYSCIISYIALQWL